MHNRKVLKTATEGLTKAKALAKPKDIIRDPLGQWKYPGQNTRIPASNITMKGVNYPVLGQPNVGQPQMMYPGQEYQFPGADYVDEFPQGNSDDYIDAELTDEEIEQYRKSGYIIEDVSVPQLTQAQFGQTVSVADQNEYNKRLEYYNLSKNLQNYINTKVNIPKNYRRWVSENDVLKGDNLDYDGWSPEIYTKGQKGYMNQSGYINIRDYRKDPNFFYDIKPDAWYHTGQMKGDSLTSKGYGVPIVYPYWFNPVLEREPLPEIGTLPSRIPVRETPEIVPQTFKYTPKKQEPIQVANRSQTIMEPDPNRPGKYRMKELRQVPYSAKFPGEAKWEPANAPGVMWINSEGQEVEIDPRKTTAAPIIIKQKEGGYIADETYYPPKHNPANSFAVNDPRSMQEGGNYFSYKGRPDAKYMKKNDGWYINAPGTNQQYIKVKDPTGSRTKLLNEQAVYHSGTKAKPAFSSIMGNVTDAFQNVINPINSDILKIGESVSGGGYNKAFAGSGTPFVISHNGQEILPAATDGTYCSGYTCGVSMKVLQQRGLLDNMTPDQLKNFQKTWYGAKDFEKGKSETLSTKALEDYNLGKRIEHKAAKPGDIAQIWRNNGSGHSVIFKDWVTDDKGNRIGIKYRSSQPNTKGIGDRTEIFGTKIDPNRIYVARLNNRSEGGESDNNYIEVDADDNDIANYIAQGYQVKELPKAQYAGQTPFVHPDAGATNILFQKPAPVKPNSKYNPKAPVDYQSRLKPEVSESTKVVGSKSQAPQQKTPLGDLNNQKNQAEFLIQNGKAARYLGDKYYNQKGDPKELTELMLREIQKNPNIQKDIDANEYKLFLERDKADRNRQSLGYTIANNVSSFIADPIVTGANWMKGEGAMMDQGTVLHDQSNPDYNNYVKATGADSYISQGANIFNPGTWAADANVQVKQGDYLGAALSLSDAFGAGKVGSYAGDLIGASNQAKNIASSMAIKKPTSAQMSDFLTKNHTIIPTQNLKSKLTALDSFLGQVVGKTLKGKGNKKAIQEGNDWLTNWINDPITQKKIDLDWEPFNTRPNFVKDEFDIAYEQAKTFDPVSKEYPLSNQLKELIKGKGNIHSGNSGVSYMHNDDPYLRKNGPYEFTPEYLAENPRRASSWISRDSFIPQVKRTSTTIHEGTHDWKSNYLLGNSGQTQDILNILTPESKAITEEWNKLRYKGINPADRLGAEKAYIGYLADPTEIDARIMQLRKQFNLTPEGSVKMTSEEAQKIMNTVKNLPKKQQLIDPQFFNIIDNDPEKLALLFRRLWGVAPVAGAASLLNSGEENTSNLNTLDLEGRSFKNGGSIELELTDKEIQAYKDGGYVVEELPKAQLGMTKTKYNFGISEAYADKQVNNLKNNTPIKESKKVVPVPNLKLPNWMQEAMNKEDIARSEYVMPIKSNTPIGIPASARNINTQPIQNSFVSNFTNTGIPGQIDHKKLANNEAKKLNTKGMKEVEQASTFMKIMQNIGDAQLAHPDLEQMSDYDQYLNRYLEKKGLINPVEFKLKSKNIKIPEGVKTYYQELGTVQDNRSTNPTDSLLSYRNQFDANKGFTYVTAPVKKDRTNKEVYNNVEGVGHFVLDASPSLEHPYIHSNNFAFLNKAIQNNDYIPIYESTGKKGEVKVSYKKANDIDPKILNKITEASNNISKSSSEGERQAIADKVTPFLYGQKTKIISPLRQMKFDEIRFDKTQSASGFSNAKEVKKSNGDGTYLIFKDRDAYSRFSGGSVTFIFKDKKGNTIAREFAGTLNNIENEGISIKKEFGLKDNELTLGYNDVGSFSAKPKAKNNVLTSQQWSGFNNENPTGGALIIPKQKR